MRARRREDIEEDTYESTQMRAQRSTHMRSQEREPHVVRAGGGESHMDMSEEPFCMEIYRKNAHEHVRRAILCGN